MSDGFLFLILQVFSTVCFGHAMKWAGWRRCDIFAVAAVNYVVASLFSYFLAVHGGQFDPGPVALPGIMGGIAYAVSFYFYFQGIRYLGLSVSTTVSRLAVMPAVLASVFYWGETLAPVQQVGVVLALLALPLLSTNKRDKAVLSSGPAWLWLLAMFSASSLGKLVMKAFQEIGLPNSNAMLFAVWFAAGAVCAIGILVARRTMPERRDILAGIVIGILNVLVNLFLLSALDELPGALVFPVSSAAAVLLATITSAGIWRERLGRVALGGIGATVASLILINIT